LKHYEIVDYQISFSEKYVAFSEISLDIKASINLINKKIIINCAGNALKLLSKNKL
jgi:hypothetical protein